MTLQQAAQDVCSCAGETEKAAEARVEEILNSHEGEPSDLIPILQAIQAELGYLPEQAMKQVARWLHMPESRVFGVATFYAQFKLVPTGRNVIKVCRGTGCHVRGAPQLLEELEKQLGVEPGGTTPDGEYTLETVACFGSCALAPVVVVNDKVEGRVTMQKVRKLSGSESGDSQQHCRDHA
jgi:NADH-quinone oxidoreductase subunit E